MFCPKCGNQIAEVGKFCPKCGNEIRTESEKKEKNIPYDIRRISIVLAIFLVIGIVVGVFVIPQKQDMNTEYEAYNDNDAYDYESNNSNEEDVSYTDYTGYPALIEVVNNDTGYESDYESDDASDYIASEDIDWEDSDINISQDTDVTDLYGTWITADRTFSISFGKDGKVRVADASNILGVDVLSYREIDENTLGLKAEGMNPVLNLVEIAMDYELRGNSLTIEFLEYRFELIQSN